MAGSRADKALLEVVGVEVYERMAAHAEKDELFGVRLADLSKQSLLVALAILHPKRYKTGPCK